VELVSWSVSQSVSHCEK